jgi:hypothetical protein
MANYALDSDVYDVIEINPLPSNALVDELTTATRDVLHKIKYEYWPPRSITNFDEDNLDDTALVKLTVYRALGWYVCPSLESYQNGEEGKWAKKAAYFQKMFEEEWLIVQQLPIYDFDEDAVFEDTDAQPFIAKKWKRG